MRHQRNVQDPHEPGTPKLSGLGRNVKIGPMWQLRILLFGKPHFLILLSECFMEKKNSTQSSCSRGGRFFFAEILLNLCSL